MGRPVRGPPPRQRRRGRNDAPLLSRIADESPSPPRDSRTAVDADRQWEAIPPPPPAPAFAPLRRRQPPRTRRSPSAMAPRPPRRITHPPKYVHNPHGRRIARARCSQHPTATAASLKSPPSPRHPPPRTPPTTTTPPSRQNSTPLSGMGCCRATLANTCQSLWEVASTCVPHGPSPQETGRAGRGWEGRAHARGKVLQNRAARAKCHFTCAPLCGRSGQRRCSATPAGARGRGRR